MHHMAITLFICVYVSACIIVIGQRELYCFSGAYKDGRVVLSKVIGPDHTTDIILYYYFKNSSLWWKRIDELSYSCTAKKSIKMSREHIQYLQCQLHRVTVLYSFCIAQNPLLGKGIFHFCLLPCLFISSGNDYV